MSNALNFDSERKNKKHYDISKIMYHKINNNKKKTPIGTTVPVEITLYRNSSSIRII